MFQYRAKPACKVKHPITSDQGGVIGLLICGADLHVVLQRGVAMEKAR